MSIGGRYTHTHACVQVAQQKLRGFAFAGSTGEFSFIRTPEVYFSLIWYGFD